MRFADTEGSFTIAYRRLDDTWSQVYGWRGLLGPPERGVSPRERPDPHVPCEPPPFADLA